AVAGTGASLEGFGGGMDAFGDLTMTDSAVTRNRSVGGSNPAGEGFYGFGGGSDAGRRATITRCRTGGNEGGGGHASGMGGVRGRHRQHVRLAPAGHAVHAPRQRGRRREQRGP